MTVGEWLASRTPAPPPALAARVRDALGARWHDPAARTAQACERGAEDLLEGLLAAHATGRESALDLLAADALVTYAFEYAAVAGADLEAESAGAMRRIAEIGARFATLPTAP